MGGKLYCLHNERSELTKDRVLQYVDQKPATILFGLRGWNK